MYHYSEKIYCEKDVDELCRVLDVGKDCLTGATLSGQTKNYTGKSRRTKYTVLHSCTVHVCKACLNGFVGKQRYANHVEKCVGLPPRYGVYDDSAFGTL